MTKIYRFNFSKEFTDKAYHFAQNFKDNDIGSFKECWQRWVCNNENIIETEKRLLCTNGYVGDVDVKMFKMVRYYLKNKTYKKPSKRRKYISLNKKLLDEINTHIKKSLHLKPEIAYNNFEKEYNLLITNELKELNKHLNENLSKKKIKKTYKNKFYHVKKSIK